MKNIDIKTLLIRLVGAACIVASIAMLFLSPWVQLDGLKRKEKTAVTDALAEIFTDLQETALDLVSDIDDLEDALEDEGLPYKKREIKTMIKNLQAPLKEIVNDGLSMQGVFSLVRALPDGMGWVNTTLDLVMDEADALYIADEYVDMMEDVQDAMEAPVLICRVLVISFLLIAVLTLAAVAGHMCNHVRWIKYLLLVLVVVLVVGSYVAVPLVSDAMQDGMEEIVESAYTLGLTTKQAATIAVLADLELKATVMPGLAAGLMLVPVVLDIIFERKKARA